MIHRNARTEAVGGRNSITDLSPVNDTVHGDIVAKSGIVVAMRQQTRSVIRVVMHAATVDWLASAVLTRLVVNLDSMPEAPHQHYSSWGLDYWSANLSTGKRATAVIL